MSQLFILYQNLTLLRTVLMNLSLITSFSLNSILLVVCKVVLVINKLRGKLDSVCQILF